MDYLLLTFLALRGILHISTAGTAMRHHLWADINRQSMQWLSNSQEFKPNVFSLFAISSAQQRIEGRAKRQDPERNDHCSLPGLRRALSALQQRGKVQLLPVHMPA